MKRDKSVFPLLLALLPTFLAEALVAGEAPQLHYTQPSPLRIELSWPSEFADYVLEESDRLEKSGKWRFTLSEPFVTGASNKVVVDADAGARFFRLRHRRPELAERPPAIEFSLVNLGGDEIVVGQPFRAEVRASFNALLAGAAFRVITPEANQALLTGRSANPFQANGLAYISALSQSPFTNGLPADLGNGGVLEVLLHSGQWPFDGIQPEDEVALEILEITPTKTGTLTVALSVPEAVTTRWAPAGVGVDRVYLDPLRSSVTVTVKPGVIPPLTNAPAPGWVAVAGLGPAELNKLVSVRSRMGANAQLPENKDADINQDGRIDLLDLIAARNAMPPPNGAAQNSQLLLNELAFNPTNGRPLWIELQLGSKAGNWWGGFEIRNAAQKSLWFAPAMPLQPGWLVLVEFDGAKPQEDLGSPSAPTGVRFHLDDPGIGFNPTNDSCLLYIQNRKVDAVAWGNMPEHGSALNTEFGALPLGGSFGRDGYESDRWVRFETPTSGEPNGLPTPMPSSPYADCGVPQGNSTHFAWLDPRYTPVVYELEVGKASDLTNPLVRTNVYSWAFDLSPGLPVGGYYWRVRSKAGAVESAWITPQPFEVMDVTFQSMRQGVSPQSTSTKPLGDSHAIQWFLKRDSVLLPRKDTRLVCLECRRYDGAHQWDSQHYGSCEHERGFIRLAMAATFNHYYQGTITQDEISYELSRPIPEPEPEHQLGHGKVFSLENALTVALDPATSVFWFQLNIVGKELTWTALRTALDLDIPAVGYLVTQGNSKSPSSVIEVIIIGYSEYGLAKGGTVRSLYVRNPYDADGYDIFPWDRIQDLSLYQPLKPPGSVDARKKDPDTVKDTDGDGLVDFDELHRFHTSPLETDTDGDGIDDMTEVVSYVFGQGFGPRKPDPTGSGSRAELNPDTDGDGCKDGEEDSNHDGTLFESAFGFLWKQADETDPFLDEEYQLDVKPDRDQLIFKEKTNIQIQLLDIAGNPLKDQTIELECASPGGHFEVSGFGSLSNTVAVTDQNGKASVVFVAEETEGMVQINAVYSACPSGDEHAVPVMIKIVPYDWIFAIQEKAVLVGPVVSSVWKVQVDSPDSAVAYQTYEKVAGYQKVAGRFFHPQTGKPGLYIDRIAAPVPQGITAALYIDGVVAPGLLWKRSSPLQNPQRWELQIANSFTPGFYTRTLDVATRGGSPRKTPLVWWTLCRNECQRRRIRVYDSSLGIWRILVWDFTAQEAMFSFGDGNADGRDTAGTWPKQIHTAVSFIPRVFVAGYSEGNFAKRDEPDISNGTWRNRDSGVYSLYDVFGFFKDTLQVVPPTLWTVQIVPESPPLPSIGTELQQLGPLLALPFLDNISFQRDFIGDELKEMTDRGLTVPTYSIQMLTGE